MPDKIINHVVIDGQPGKFYAPNVLTGLEETEAMEEISDDVNELKSDFADMQSDGVVPSAEQILTDKGVTDSVPYHYRKTGGDGADRLYDQVVGGTVCFNQLVEANITSKKEVQGITRTATADGSGLIYSGTATQTDNYTAAQVSGIIQGHKYLLTVGNANLPVGARLCYSGNDQSPSTVWQADAITTQVSVRINNGVAVNFTAHPQVLDLTAMFGTTIADYIYQLEQTTAGAGVAWFRKLFPNNYYPYNAGELISVSGLSEHRTVGFNQWDEEWEVGAYNVSTGAKSVDTARIRNKNIISVKGGKSYYFALPYDLGTYGTYLFKYDSNREYIGGGQIYDKVIILDTDVAYINFCTQPIYGTTYNHDICINISSSRDGEYEPYEAHSYPLDDSLELRGLPKLDADNNLVYDGDVYESTGKVTRNFANKVFVGADIGECWNLQSINEHDIANFGFGLSPDKYITGVSLDTIVRSNWYGDKVQTTTIANTSEEGIFFANGDIFYVRISKSKASTVAEFKAYLAEHPLEIVYKLATPTTESADPYQHLQQCDPNGTEEYVSTGIVPVGHETRYPENLRAKIEGLPWDFSSLIAPTEKTTTASRNYTAGSLLIMGNTLYKVTASIANGGTITPNTNVTATTLSEIISALAQ